jgi:two-component system nitrogen regulation response regulator NtrX
VADVDRLVGARASALGGLGALEECTTFEEFKLASEHAFLLAKLRQHDWNVAETARVLGMPRSNLYKKIERHQLAREQE